MRFQGREAWKRKAPEAALGCRVSGGGLLKGRKSLRMRIFQGSKLNFALQLADMSQGSCNLALRLMESHRHPLRADRKPLAQKGPWHVQHHFHG